MGRNISKNLRSKYSQKRIDHAKQSAKDALKTASKRVIQKIAEATGHLIEHKITNKITWVSKTSPKNNLETNEQKILRKRFISSDVRQKIWSKIKWRNILFYN